MKFSVNRLGCAVLLCASPLLAFAQDEAAESDPVILPEMVVTATRAATPTREVGSSVTVISAEEIEKSQKTSVADILRTVPGLDVVRAGGSGQLVSVFTRGSNSNHTLVLVDGIEATDPSNPTNQFDFSGLQVDDIERIEVVRGPQSTLYGSDAIGGVIQIFTKRGAGARSYAQLEAGSFGSQVGRGGFHGGDQWVGYGLTFSLQKTDGVSAFPTGDEEDGYDNKTLSGYVSVRPTADSTVDFSLRRVEFDTDIDSYDSATFAFTDDTDSRLHTEQWLARLQGGYSLLEGRWTQRLGVSWTDYDRINSNGAEPGNTTPGETRFTGRKTKLDWVHDYQFDDMHQLSIGIETEDEEAELSASQDPETGTDGILLQDHLRFSDVFFTTIGVRRDNHDDFGSVTTYRITPVYVFADTGTRLKASYGTGFKAPSLSSLFESAPPFFLANPDLKPERSKGWDIGVEQTLLDDQLRFALTYFNSDIEDLIVFVSDPVTFVGTLENVDKASSKGYELELRYALLPTVALGMSYTHTRAINETTGADLVRRPRTKATLYADWQAMPELDVNFSGRYVGKHDDTDANFLPAVVKSYQVFDLALAYTLTPQWALMGRVENAADEEYEEIAGYGTPGRAWYAGVRFSP